MPEQDVHMQGEEVLEPARQQPQARDGLRRGVSPGLSSRSGIRAGLLKLIPYVLVIPGKRPLVPGAYANKPR